MTIYWDVKLKITLIDIIIAINVIYRYLKINI